MVKDISEAIDKILDDLNDVIKTQMKDKDDYHGAVYATLMGVINRSNLRRSDVIGILEIIKFELIDGILCDDEIIKGDKGDVMFG